MTDGQRTLESVPFEVLKEAVRQVLREEGLIRGEKRESWPHEYKGDAFWLECRVRAIRLIKANVYIGHKDLDQDPWFAGSDSFGEYVQWHRAVRAHLVRNRPRGPDRFELVTFSLDGRRAKLLTFRGWLHCAIAEAAARMKDPALVRRTRAKYGATRPCERCQALTGPSQYEGPNPQSEKSGERPAEALDEEELAILRAQPEGAVRR